MVSFRPRPKLCKPWRRKLSLELEKRVAIWEPLFIKLYFTVNRNPNPPNWASLHQPEVQHLALGSAESPTPQLPLYSRQPKVQPLFTSVGGSKSDALPFQNLGISKRQRPSHHYGFHQVHGDTWPSKLPKLRCICFGLDLCQDGPDLGI